MYTNVRQYTSIGAVNNHFLQLKPTKPYKLYGNNKIKAKHRIQFKRSLKLYKSLTKYIF